LSGGSGCTNLDTFDFSGTETCTVYFCKDRNSPDGDWAATDMTASSPIHKRKYFFFIKVVLG